MENSLVFDREWFKRKNIEAKKRAKKQWELEKVFTEAKHEVHEEQVNKVMKLVDEMSMEKALSIYDSVMAMGSL